LSETDDAVLVHTAQGTLAGFKEEGVSVFKGIPYAQPPVGPGRFEPPRAPLSWSGVRNARAYGPQAVQTNSDVENLMCQEIIQLASYLPEAHPISEDCLYLNVWTPAADDGRRPVMVWCHGGGFYTGSGNSSRTDGGRLSAAGDVVVISMNHRLGVLGFLHLADLSADAHADAGNLGLLDLVAALQWVRQNVAAFGGDPNCVTIFGLSGGGGKVGALMNMPSARGLFHRAIIQSGPWCRYRTREDATQVAAAVLGALGLDRSDIDLLRTVPVAALSRAQSQVMKQLLDRPFPRDGAMTDCHFGPVLDGRCLPSQPLDPAALEIAGDVPLMIGSTKDESTYLLSCDPEVYNLTEQGLNLRLEKLFHEDAQRLLGAYREALPAATPTELYIAITSDYLVRNGSIAIAQHKARLASAPVYMYLFTYETSVMGGRLKSHHGLDNPFIFNRVDLDPFPGTDPRRFELGRVICRAWTSFARYGNPNHDRLPHWPAYRESDRATMLLNAESEVVCDPNRPQRLAWLSG
jgi:para-nitrobenzyl esterase